MRKLPYAVQTWYAQLQQYKQLVGLCSSGLIMTYQDDKSMTKMGWNVHVPVTFEHYTLPKSSKEDASVVLNVIIKTGGLQMTVRDAINRGYNLVGTAIIAISGFAFFPEFFTEDEFTHKLDEGALLLLAIGSIVWYLTGKNKFSRTIVPILFTSAALVMKLIAFFLLEKGDAADLGDEFSAIILFVITLGFLVWQYASIKRMAQTAEKEAAEAVHA